MQVGAIVSTYTAALLQGDDADVVNACFPSPPLFFSSSSFSYFLSLSFWLARLLSFLSSPFDHDEIPPRLIYQCSLVFTSVYGVPGYHPPHTSNSQPRPNPLRPFAQILHVLQHPCHLLSRKVLSHALWIPNPFKVKNVLVHNLHRSPF